MIEHEITRRNGKKYTVLLDDEDAHLLEEYSWSIRQSRTCFYAQTMVNRTVIHMHELICKTHLDVDHIDGNGLNNTRSNLRPATRSQNLANQRPQAGRSSQYKGVCWEKSKNKWVAYIKINGKRKYLGRFDDEVLAAKQYDEAAIAAWGEFARPNFPKELADV